MPKLNHPLKMLAISVTVFLMGYFLESFRDISSIVGDYFTISTELLPLVLSFSIFGITWYSYRRSRDNHSLFLGAAFLVIGLFDLFHLLSYPFMPDFITPNSTHKSEVFWGEARIISALLFLASAYVYKDTLAGKITKSTLFVSSVAFSFLALAVTLFYLDGQSGLPPDSFFSAEMLITSVTAAIIAYTSYLYSKRLGETGQKNLICLLYGFIIIIFSLPAYFFYEYPEHLLRAAGFYFVYNAIYKSSIDQPYEKLRQVTEEKYRSLFDNAHDAIITSDLGGYITSWNRSAEEMFGWKADEVIGKNLIELIVPSGLRQEGEQSIRKAIEGKAVKGIDAVYLRKDGTEIDVSVTISPLRGADENAIALSCIMRDITERKQTEDKLRHRLELEKLIMNLSTNFINIAPDDIDTEINHTLRVIGEFTRVDRSYVFLLSDDGLTINNTHEWCTDQEVPQAERPRVVPFESFPWFAQKMRRLETIYIPRIADLPPEAEIEKAAFEKTPIKSILDVPLVSGGSFIGYLGLTSVKREITWSEDLVALLKIVGEIFVNALVRKWAEEALQHSEGKYRMLVENIQDGVFIIQDTKIQFVNEAFARLAGYKAEEVIGRDFRELIAPEDAAMVTDRYFRRQTGDTVPKEYEFRVLRRDGKRMTVNMNVGLITYRGRTASMGTMRDITERKQAEEALSWQVEINAAMVELSSTLLSPATVEEISALVLEHAKLLTNSPYGYVGYIDPKTGYLVCPTMTRDMMDICRVKDKNNILKEFKGLFGWVLTNGKSILTNSPGSDPRSSGTPPGHIPIHRFLSAPALLKRKLVGELSVASSVGNKIHVMRYYDRGSLVGQIALANSDRDYTERDLSLVERLADIYAIAINRYWAEEQIKDSLKEKEVLLREIHHRVKNNMQIISSLLRLQSRDITEKKYVDMFMESQNRITSMALIHEKLYQSKGLVKIDFKDYMRDLVTGLFQSYGVNGRIALNIDVRDVSLGIDSAIPCGLIVNELTTNALKHAFPGDRKGEIKISLYPVGENMIELIVSDDGVSIPESVDIRKTESLGLHLVTILVENQLHGDINLNRSKGTEFLIKFKDVK